MAYFTNPQPNAIKCLNLLVTSFPHRIWDNVNLSKTERSLDPPACLLELVPQACDIGGFREIEIVICYNRVSRTHIALSENTLYITYNIYVYIYIYMLQGLIYVNIIDIRTYV